MNAASVCRKRLSARDTGLFVPSLTGRGEVVSVYSKAINVRHEKGFLIAAVEHRSQMTALSLTLPSLFRMIKKNEIEIRPGDSTLFKGHVMMIKDTGIVLNREKGWEGVLAGRDIRGFDLSVVSRLGRALAARGRKGGMLGLLQPAGRDDLFLRKARRCWHGMLVQTDSRGGANDLSPFVGLGTGLTPAGDDLITGCLMGERILELLGAFTEKRPFRGRAGTMRPSINKNEIMDAMHRTNDAGRSLLWLALKGHFPQYLITAVRGLSGQVDGRDVLDVAEKAARHGETSGTDSLVGLYLYMTAALGSAFKNAEGQVLP